MSLEDFRYEYRAKRRRGFESHPLRHFVKPKYLNFQIFDRSSIAKIHYPNTIRKTFQIGTPFLSKHLPIPVPPKILSIRHGISWTHLRAPPLPLDDGKRILVRLREIITDKQKGEGQ